MSSVYGEETEMCKTALDKRMVKVVAHRRIPCSMSIKSGLTGELVYETNDSALVRVAPHTIAVIPKAVFHLERGTVQ